MRDASAVIIFGPPGSGKSTQAALLADTLAYEVVDTGRLLRVVLYDPARQEDPVIKAERERFDTGVLVTPSFIVDLLRSHLMSLAAAGVSCVIGGSPRTMGEAEALLPELIAAYGPANVHCVLLDTPLEVCKARSLARAICNACGRPQLAMGPATEAPKRCRACGGELYVRADITAIETRFDEYQARTVPVFAFAESLGLRICRVDGAEHPGAVYGEIVDAIDR